MAERKILNDAPFQHSGPNGTNAVAPRCDFRDGVVFLRPKNITDAQFAVDVATIIGWHATMIHPQLNGFSGYDAFTATVNKVG